LGFFCFRLRSATSGGLLQIDSRSFDVVVIARQTSELRERICPSSPDIRAQVVYAVQKERTERVADFLLRRTGIETGPCLGKDCCATVAKQMGELPGWASERTDAEIQDYLHEIALGQTFRQA